MASKNNWAKKASVTGLAVFIAMLPMTVPATKASPRTSLQAPTWRAGIQVMDVLRLPGKCAATWYDPEVFVYPDGNFGFYTQGNMANPCTTTVGEPDSIFRAKYDISTNAWQFPAANSCPTLLGTYATTTCPGQEGIAPYQPLGSPAIAKVGSKYYMASVGGNADTRKGYVFWATSTDGVNWTILKSDPKPAGFAWKPLIYPKYGDFCQPFAMSQLSHNYWLRVFAVFAPFLYWQSTTSLSSGIWSTPQIVDMSQFDAQVAARYPTYSTNIRFYGGLWWGRVRSRTGMWLFQPADYLNCGGFGGLGIFIVALNYS